MEIFLDDNLLAVKKREDHGDSNSRCIIKSMKERSGEKNFISHPFKERDLYLTALELSIQRQIKREYFSLMNV